MFGLFAFLVSKSTKSSPTPRVHFAISRDRITKAIAGFHVPNERGSLDIPIVLDRKNGHVCYNSS